MYYKHEYDKGVLEQHTKAQASNAATRMKVIAAKRKSKKEKKGTASEA